MSTAAGFGRSRFADGLHPSELWGVARNPKQPRKRGEAARARRRAKKAARLRGMPLKAYLREVQP